MTQPDASSDFHPHRDDRDPSEVGRKLSGWFAGLTADGVAPEIALPGDDNSGNGVSSETVPIRVTWPRGAQAPAGQGAGQGAGHETGHETGHEAGHAAGQETDDYVVRMAPLPGDVPVFRTYRLQDQFETMRLVGELTSVPVPKVHWLEPGGTVLDRPFFVMDAIAGEVPSDIPPYNLGDSWLFNALPEEQQRLQESSVAVIAQLHQIPGASEKFGFLMPRFDGDTPLRRHLAWARDWYEYAADGLGQRSPLVDKSLDWLDAHCPAPAEDPVLCWGDARIGNILFQDFTPAGVLDWEMATLGPRQLDLTWMFFSHRVFEHIAKFLEIPGMPDFMREEDVVARYEALTGTQVGDLTWYRLYAAVQWSVVFLRTGASMVHFKERDMPAEIEELIYHRELLEELARDAGALS